MTRVLCLGCVTVLALMIAPTPPAEAQTPGPVYESAPVTVTATIEAIDKTARLVTLKGPKGQSVEVKADENVEGFDKLKVGRVRDPQLLQGVKIGDTIDVTVTRGLLIKVERPE